MKTYAIKHISFGEYKPDYAVGTLKQCQDFMRLMYERFNIGTSKAIMKFGKLQVLDNKDRVITEFWIDDAR